MANLDYKRALKELTVLCCEDQVDARNQLERVFRDRVAKLFIADNGITGLDLYKDFKPDLIISDIKMPRMSGLELATEIKKINPKAQIILLTAFDHKNFMFDAINIGVSQYVTKPIGEKKLFDAIYRCMDMVIAEKKINFQNQYIQNILDLQKNLVFVTDGKNFYVANKSFLDYSGYGSIKEIMANKNELGESVFINGAKESWLETLISAPEKRQHLSMTIGGMKDAFIAETSMFPDIPGRYLVSLIRIDDTTEILATGFEAPADPLSTFLSINDFIQRANEKLENGGESFVLYLRLGDFETLNRVHGYLKANECLQKTASVARECFPDGTLFCHLYGAEFAVMRFNTTKEQARDEAGRFKASLLKNLGQIQSPLNLSIDLFNSSDIRDGGEVLRLLQLRLAKGGEAATGR